MSLVPKYMNEICSSEVVLRRAERPLHLGGVSERVRERESCDKYSREYDLRPIAVVQRIRASGNHAVGFKVRRRRSSGNAGLGRWRMIACSSSWRSIRVGVWSSGSTQGSFSFCSADDASLLLTARGQDVALD